MPQADEFFVDNARTRPKKGRDLQRMNGLGYFHATSRVNVLAAVAATIGFTAALSAQAQPLPSPMPPATAPYANPLRDELAVDWLDRISRSAKELPYSGVFVHQTAEGASTSRITHLVDKQGGRARKTRADGWPPHRD